MSQAKPKAQLLSTMCWPLPRQKGSETELVWHSMAAFTKVWKIHSAVDKRFFSVVQKTGTKGQIFATADYILLEKQFRISHLLKSYHSNNLQYKNAEYR